jgi:hypothetical protein
MKKESLVKVKYLTREEKYPFLGKVMIIKYCYESLRNTCE